MLERVSGEEHNKAVVKRYFEMLNSGETAQAHQILHPRWVDHAHPEVHDATEVVRSFAEKGKVFDRLQVVIDRMVSEGDHVAVHSTIHRGSNGRTTVSRAMWFIRMEEGKISEMWTAHEPVANSARPAELTQIAQQH